MVTPAGHEVQSRSSNDIFREHAELIPALSTLPPQKIHVYGGIAGAIALSEMMTRLHKIAVALVVCGLVPLGGCTRTSDGTVVMKKPPSLATLLPANPFRKQRETAHAPVAASQFPPVPHQPAGAGQTTTKQARRKPVVAKTTLACLNQTQPGDRVRVVCD